MNEILDNTLISEAFLAGRQAGKLTLAPSLCPFADGTIQAEQWRLGWMFSNAEAARYANAQIKRDKERPQWANDLDGGARDDSQVIYRGRAA